MSWLFVDVDGGLRINDPPGLNTPLSPAEARLYYHGEDTILILELSLIWAQELPGVSSFRLSGLLHNFAFDRRNPHGFFICDRITETIRLRVSAAEWRKAREDLDEKVSDAVTHGEIALDKAAVREFCSLTGCTPLSFWPLNMPGNPPPNPPPPTATDIIDWIDSRGNKGTEADHLEAAEAMFKSQFPKGVIPREVWRAVMRGISPELKHRRGELKKH